MKKVILSLIVLAAVFSIAEASPFQTMGMLRTPDAYVLPNKAAEFQFVNYFRQTRTEDMKYVPYGMVSVGILDRIELGLYGGDEVFFANAKIKLLKETLKLPQVSVGLENIFSRIPGDAINDLDPGEDLADHPDKADYEAYSPYIVLSKQAVVGGMNSMFNIGVGMNRFVGQVQRSRVFSGSFASIEMMPFNNFSVLGEYDGRDFNIGAKYAYKNFAFKAGYQGFENLFKESEGNGYEEDRRFAFSISYLFDRYATSKRRPDILEFASNNSSITGDDLANQDLNSQNGEFIDGTAGINSPGDATTSSTGLTGTDVAVTDAGTSTTGNRTPTPEMQDLATELQRLQAERQRAESALQELRNWINSLRTPTP